MQIREVAPGLFEYGNVLIPVDLNDLRLVAAKEPQSNHFMVVSMRTFYLMTKKCMAYDVISEALKKKEESESGKQLTEKKP